MRTITTCLLATLALAATAQDELDPGQMFETGCAGCHRVPDLRFATDAAWLGQVARTA